MSKDLFLNCVDKITFTKARHPECKVTITIQNNDEECSYSFDETRIKMLIGMLQSYIQDWSDYRVYYEEQTRLPLLPKGGFK